MYEHFTISAPAPPAGSTSSNISPRDTRSPSPSPPIYPSDTKQRAQSTFTQLASHLDDMKPRKDNNSSSYFCTSSNSLGTPTNETVLPPELKVASEFENELAVDPDYETDTKSSSSSLPTLRIYRRLQRQLNSQLWCTHSKVEAISDLVEEMVSNKSQCNVSAPSISQPSTDPSNTSLPEDLEANDNILSNSVDDEGYCEGEAGDDDLIDPNTLLMNLRRASTPLGIRQQEYAKGAVLSRPRMRRKILRRKRPENQPENREETGT